jgi:hypothetical protein
MNGHINSITALFRKFEISCLSTGKTIIYFDRLQHLESDSTHKNYEVIKEASEHSPIFIFFLVIEDAML